MITRGPRGSLARCGDGIDRYTPPSQVDTIDESGAGDAFTAGLITGLLETGIWSRFSRFASAVGASCTRALGLLMPACFTFDEAVSLLETPSAAEETGLICRLSPSPDILADARSGCYGVRYCESWNLESVQAVWTPPKNANRRSSPDSMADFCGIISRTKPENLACYAGLRLALGYVHVPVAFLLNESTATPRSEPAIELGFNAVMPENEGLDPDQYRKLVNEVVAFAHPRNVWVEAQIGRSAERLGRRITATARSPTPTRASRLWKRPAWMRWGCRSATCTS